MYVYKPQLTVCICMAVAHLSQVVWSSDRATQPALVSINTTAASPPGETLYTFGGGGTYRINFQDNSRKSRKFGPRDNFPLYGMPCILCSKPYASVLLWAVTLHNFSFENGPSVSAVSTTINSVWQYYCQTCIYPRRILGAVKPRLNSLQISLVGWLPILLWLQWAFTIILNYLPQSQSIQN